MGTARDVASIVASAGELVGKTRLQKTGVILEIAGVGFGFPFEYHLFGPYSEELTISADRAVALRYISEDVRRANWGGVYSSFRAPQIAASGDEARDELISIARDADSIVLELTATAAFLANAGEANPWDEVAERKPEKATRHRLIQAKALYRQFAAVRTPVPLPAIA